MTDTATAVALRVGRDRRHIVDESGDAVLIQGDAAWSLIANLTVDDATWYLDQRSAQGFNAVLINLIERLFAVNAPRDLSGTEPFTTPGDFTTPNEAYWAHAEQVIDLARERGIIAILYPAFLGYPQPHYPGYEGQAEGWYDEVVANGPEGCRAYGEYLGRRLGGNANVIWSIGADRNPEQARAGLEAIAAGIKSTAPGDLMTAQMLPEHSAAEHYPDADWLDVLSTYSYSIIPRLLERDWSSPPTPPLLPGRDRVRERAQHEPASDPPCRLLVGVRRWRRARHGQQADLDVRPRMERSRGERRRRGAQSRWGEFFRSIDWSTLVPDHEKTLVSGGRGEDRGLNQIGAARSGDGRLAIVYVPEQRPLTVETGVLAGPGVVATWFDPVTGQRQPGGTLAVGGPAVLTPPFRDDAVLLLEAAALPADGR